MYNGLTMSLCLVWATKQRIHTKWNDDKRYNENHYNFTSDGQMLTRK